MFDFVVLHCHYFILNSVSCKENTTFEWFSFLNTDVILRTDVNSKGSFFHFCGFVFKLVLCPNVLISTPEINRAAAAAGNSSKRRRGSRFTDRTNKLLDILTQRAGLRRCLFQTEMRRKSVGHFTWDFQLLKQDVTEFYLQLQPVNKHTSLCNNLQILML